MKIVSANLNGIRAAARKGFFDWFAEANIDILCVQETKAQQDQLTDDVFHPPGYHVYFVDAVKKGYSGVALYTKQKPDHVETQIGIDWADEEGRYIRADFGQLSVVSLYLPSGSSGDHRQNFKWDFLNQYEQILSAQMQDDREYILCGDWNIVHKAIDIKNFKSNQKTSGCLPEERAWLDKVFDEIGYKDAFRLLNQEKDQYTWWSNRGQARAKNVGWRIDYQIITPGLANKVTSVDIYKETFFSDHAPLIVEYALS